MWIMLVMSLSSESLPKVLVRTRCECSSVRLNPLITPDRVTLKRDTGKVTRQERIGGGGIV